MKWDREIEKDLKTVHQDDTLGELVKRISKSKRNLFPVIDEENHLIGVVLLDHVRDIMFNREMYNDTYVRDLMVTPPTYVVLEDTMETVMEKFNESNEWNLPVLDGDKYIGFISKSRIFSAYRKVLQKHSEE